MNVKIKLCGITRMEDARSAVDAGADALGFMFYEKSVRRVSRAQASEIIRELPPLVAKVGVFVNPDEAFVRQAISECGLDTVQFHGEETPEFCARFSEKVWKAFRIRDAASLAALAGYEVDAWLLDSYVAGQPGGTGERFNWNLAVEARQLGKPIVLAGGLTPENAAQAVREVRPFAVDVSSGVESAPGIKDAGKIRKFIAAVRQAEQVV